MKKIILALFLVFGFANAEFSVIVTDESGNELEKGTTEYGIDVAILKLENQLTANFELNATDVVTWGSLFGLKNSSDSNLLIRFNNNKTIDKDGKEVNKQIILQAGSMENFFSSPYYAFTSCLVEKTSKNRPTKSFFIINKDDTKILNFLVRNCETGDIEYSETFNGSTPFSALKTTMSDVDTTYHGEENLGAPIGLPAVVIARQATRDLAVDYGGGHGGEFICKDDKLSNVSVLKLYDGSGIDITDKANIQKDNNSAKVTFTIPNDSINYRKMHFRVECKTTKANKGKQNIQIFYFDARPKAIRVSGLPSADEWLYAEYEYKSDGSAYNDEFSSVIKTEKSNQKGSFESCDKCKVVEDKLQESKTMKAITLNAIDANDNIINNYVSITDMAIFGKVYTDGIDSISGEEIKAKVTEIQNDNTLGRACVFGGRNGCTRAYVEINGASSEVFTGVSKIDGQNSRVLSYNNAGKTVLYSVDTEWTKFSQSFTSGAELNENLQVAKSILCDMDETHDEEQAKTISGKTRNLVGCNIPFVDEKGSDELNFYFFKPAIYKLLFESKNSPSNDSYGTDKFTYIHSIKAEDYDATNNKIFETADFSASMLVIGASLDSLENNRTLSHYDNHLKVAEKLKFSGNPINPIVTVEDSKANDIAEDFSVTLSDDEADISGALIVTLEPKNPYHHENGYKNNPTLSEITSKESITINREKDSFYSGKNIKANKLNFKREDLLARSYVHLGMSSVDINMSDPKNAPLSQKMNDDQAAFIFSYDGDDLNFVDAAIIAPNVASNEETADAAVYLAGFCDATNCSDDFFISNRIANHMNYYGFNFNVMNQEALKEDASDEEKEQYKKIEAETSLFGYSGASFGEFRNGADFLKSFNANEVKIELKGDQAKEYCEIFRNCYPLSDGTSYGAVFNSFKISENAWHGGGDKQGKTIVDSIANDNKKTRRKEQRLSF